MTIFMVFVCFTSGEGQAPQCHPAYPKQYASADECEVFSQNDTYVKNYLKGVRNGQYQRGVSVEVLCMKKAVIEGFSHFVTSMTAPIASGWSDCRVGVAPTGKRRLCTAHTHLGHRPESHLALVRTAYLPDSVLEIVARREQEDEAA
jgi:hypothetical protein